MLTESRRVALPALERKLDLVWEIHRSGVSSVPLRPMGMEEWIVLGVERKGESHVPFVIHMGNSNASFNSQ